MPPRANAARSPRASRAAPIFAALGDETRLRLVSTLCDEGPSSTSRLTEGTDVTRQAITKHLQTLERVGLVRVEREGREAVWALERRKLGDARRYLEEISVEWDAALERLRAMVEE